MARVIQDSDDDLEDDLEVDAHQPEKKDVSPKHPTSDTSSTEALRKQIEAAHRAHLQSQFPVNPGHTPVVNDGTHQKGKTPAGFHSDSTSSEHFASKEVPVIDGRNPKGIFTSSPPGQQENQNSLRQALQPTATPNELDCVLDGSMSEAYVQHNPNEMFPDPSSTVPNATLTQQRVLEGVLAPVLLGSDIDASRVPFQPDASIPWSEYLKSPTNTGERPSSSAQEPHVSQITPTVASELPLNEHSAAPLSQQSRRGSLTLVGSPLAHDTCPDAIDTQDITIFTKEKNQSMSITLSTVDGLAQEEPSSLHRRSRKKRPSPAVTLDNDLADLGLPKEQYKPRPSRSRSLKVGTQESIDYSIRPEKATQASKRGISTPATASLAKPLNTPNKLQQICDMGFTSSTSERAVNRNNGDVIQSIDWLIPNGIAEDELVSHSSQMSSFGGYQGTANTNTQRQGVVVQTNRLDAEQTSARDAVAKSAALNHIRTSAELDNIAPKVDIRGPAKVQVVIPTKLPKTFFDTPAITGTSRKKAKRRKTTLDPPEPTEAYSVVNEAKVEKKRGRGRPKKVAKAPVSTEIVKDDEDQAPPAQGRGCRLPPADANIRPSTAQDQDTERNIAANAIEEDRSVELFQPEDTITATVISETTPEPPVLPDRPEVEPITPERVKKPAAQEQPSNNKAKVPYRVGLSKRARIAPLLRVMKK